LERLKEIAKKLDVYRVKLVILFGSRARGDYTDESDIDLLIVADNLPNDPREAYEAIRKLIEDPNIHPICLKTNSFIKKLENESTFIMEIIEDGKIIYANETFLEKTMAKYKEIRKRWIRKGKTWEKITRQTQ